MPYFYDNASQIFFKIDLLLVKRAKKLDVVEFTLQGVVPVEDGEIFGVFNINEP